MQHFESYEVNNCVYSVNDDVYIIETGDSKELPFDDDDDLCCVCHASDDSGNMIECSRCLGGFHMTCLKPKLKKVPEVRLHVRLDSLWAWAHGRAAMHALHPHAPGQAHA